MKNNPNNPSGFLETENNPNNPSGFLETQDWQIGDDSKTPPLQRIDLHNEWLKKIHQDIQDNIKPEIKLLSNDEPVGFPKD